MSQDRSENPYAAPVSETNPFGQAPLQFLKPHRGVLIIVLGVLSFMICLILGIVAWVMANKDLAEMDAGRMDPKGRTLTIVGKVLGILSVVFLGLQVVMGLVFVALEVYGQYQ